MCYNLIKLQILLKKKCILQNSQFGKFLQECKYKEKKNPCNISRIWSERIKATYASLLSPLGLIVFNIITDDLDEGIGSIES